MNKATLEKNYKLTLQLTDEEIQNYKVILHTFKTLGDKSGIAAQYPGAALLADAILHSIEGDN